ncbi:hypothetical protein TNCV_2109341 [Trichonephila clavipes]|nr:hypothetical protein TNCV_2109341 [Trichonephila clavipes]
MAKENGLGRVLLRGFFHKRSSFRNELRLNVIGYDSDTMASAVLADPTRALQETNQVSGPAMEESEKDVETLEKLLLYADEHYLAGKLPLEDHLGKDMGPWGRRISST